MELRLETRIATERVAPISFFILAINWLKVLRIDCQMQTFSAYLQKAQRMHHHFEGSGVCATLGHNASWARYIQFVTAFLQLVDLKYGTTAEIVNSIKSSFQSINIMDDFNKKLIGFAGDGATVNHRDRKREL